MEIPVKHKPVLSTKMSYLYNIKIFTLNWYLDPQYLANILWSYCFKLSKYFLTTCAVQCGWGGREMKISVTNCDYFELNLPIKARRKTSKRCLKNILFWAAVTGVDSVKRENTGLNHNILQWWMMILIQPEWESATPNQPADRCRTDWFMPRVAYINQLSAGNGS